MKRFTRIFAVVAALVAASVSSSVRANYWPANLTLNTNATNVTLQITASGLGGQSILNPTVQTIPFVSGGLTMDVDQTGNVPPPVSLANISGLLSNGLGLYIANPWTINTIVGPLVLTGGHISVGPGAGPYAITGNSVDLGGLALSLDGGAGTIIGNNFDFGTDPANFTIPSPTIATFTESGAYPTYNVSLSIPVDVDGTADVGGFLGILTYSLNGQIVFDGTKTVPEPSALSLLAVSGLSLVMRRRRR